MDAFARINNAGGNASLVVSTQGGHRFFKAGDTYNADVMASCFVAIDTLVKQAESLKAAVIDGATLPDTSITVVESKIFEADEAYENYSKVLSDFHNGIEHDGTSNRTKLRPRRNYSGKLQKLTKELQRRFWIEMFP